MQGKGLITSVTVLLVLICLYYLSFTFFANRVESAATANATEQSENMTFANEVEKNAFIRESSKAYLDSMDTESVVPLLGTSYKKCKQRRLNLGLDLQGGMSVVLQVALEGVIKSLSGNSKDQTFLAALDRANQMETTGDDDYVTLFARAYGELAPGKPLSNLFATQENQASINNKSSDQEVMDFIRNQSGDAIETTFEIIRTRIDKFGVANPNISLQKDAGRILVELPGVDDPERIRKMVTEEANLEFWEVKEVDGDVVSWWDQINSLMQKQQGIDPQEDKVDNSEDVSATAITVDANGDTIEVDSDELGLDDSSESDSLDVDDFTAKNPFYALFRPIGQAGFPYCGEVYGSDRTKLKNLLESPEVKQLLPRNIKLLIGKKPSGTTDDGKDAYLVYAIEGRGANMEAPLNGSVITSAQSQTNPTGGVEISMSMNSEGASTWARLTKKNIQQSIAIVLDDEVVSAPNVQSEIKGGRSSITGQFDLLEGKDLANVLKIGKLPAKPEIIEEAVVGPTLGAKSIRNGIASLLIGLGLVLLFMAFYYAKAGIVSIIALVMNMFLIIGILASLGASLTLPGIAGIVLTIGMAVDANVIIYERIREELAKGSTRKKAILDGFRYSYSAIIDANLTTLITAIILAYFGLGPVLGFATILIIGIATSLFTAVLLTKFMIDWAEDRGIAMSFSNGAERFKNLAIDFVSRRKINYLVSAFIILVGVASMVSRGFELGVDFEGGRTYVIQMDEKVPTEDIAKAFTAAPAVMETAPQVTTYGGDNQIKLTTSHRIQEKGDAISGEIETMLYDKLKGFYPAGLTMQQFTKEKIQSSQIVGPTIADDITRGAIWATIYALIGIFLYILIRFRKWQFGTAAVVTVIHDTLILLSVFSIFHHILPFGMEINQAFIAALLTVIGYSINDTVVVFDRIREYLGESSSRGKKYLDVVNEAINSTLSRTVITSLTTFFVVAVLFFFGGSTIKGFAFALMIGVIVGTYSSIFIATPLVIDLQGAKKDSRVEATNIEVPRPIRDVSA